MRKLAFLLVFLLLVGAYAVPSATINVTSYKAGATTVYSRTASTDQAVVNLTINITNSASEAINYTNVSIPSSWTTIAPSVAYCYEPGASVFWDAWVGSVSGNYWIRCEGGTGNNLANPAEYLLVIVNLTAPSSSGTATFTAYVRNTTFPDHPAAYATATTSASGNDQMVTETRAALSMAISPSAQSRIVKGEQGILFNFTVQDTGQADATNVAIYPATRTYMLNDSAGASMSVSPSPPSLNPNAAQLIVGGTTTSYQLTFTVPTAATTGYVRYYVNSSGQDENSLQHVSTVQQSSSSGFYIINRANISVLNVTSSNLYISMQPANRTFNVTTWVSAQSGDYADANITDANINFYTIDGTDRTSQFAITKPTFPITVTGGSTAMMVFTVTGLNAPEGVYSLNASVDYFDVITYGTGQASAQNSKGSNATKAMYVDRTEPVLGWNTPSTDGLWMAQGQFLTLNVTAHESNITGTNTSGSGLNTATGRARMGTGAIDTYYAVSTPSLQTSFTCDANSYCSNSTAAWVPNETSSISFYGDQNLVVSLKDYTDNEGVVPTRNVKVYTLKVYLSNSGGRDAPNGNVTVMNVSGGQTIYCGRDPVNTSVHYCPVMPGTNVTIQAIAPGHLMNNDSSGVCVGTLSGSTCLTALPYYSDSSRGTGNFVFRSYSLTPNTVIRARDEFGRAIPKANITIDYGGGTYTFVTEGDSNDLDTGNTNDGNITVAIDTTSHPNPINISVGKYDDLTGISNYGYLSWRNNTITIINSTLNEIVSGNRFTVIVTMVNEFGQYVNETGSPSVTYNYNNIGCVRNNTINTTYAYNYGCPVPTGQQDGTLYYTNGGATINISAPSLGYVDYVTEKVRPPLNYNDAQNTTRTYNKFTIRLIPKNQFGQVISFDSSDAANFTWSTGSGRCLYNATYQGGFWGCPLPDLSEANWIALYPDATRGYLGYNITGIDADKTAQQNSTSANNFTILFDAYDELGNQINASMLDGSNNNVKFISADGSRTCQNGTTNHWGCPVPVTFTAAGLIDVTAVTSPGYYLNYTIGGIAIPQNIQSSSSFNVSANKYAVKVETYSELSKAINTTGGNVTFGGGATVCFQYAPNPYIWHCPMAVGTSGATVVTTKSGFQQYSNTGVNAPARDGTQLTLTTASQYNVLVTTRDQLNLDADMRVGGYVLFVAGTTYTCVNSTTTATQWGCAVPSGTSGNVTVTGPGFLNYSSYTEFGRQITSVNRTITTGLVYTLMANVTDELGVAFNSATVTATGASSPCQEASSKYYCRVPNGTAPTVTVAKEGFVTRTNATAVPQINVDGSQVVVQFTGSGSVQYGLRLQVRPEGGITPSGYTAASLMSSGITFWNRTTGSIQNQITPNASQTSGSSGYNYYFALPSQNIDILTNKSGFQDDLQTSLSVSQSALTQQQVNLQYSARVRVVAENNTVLGDLVPYTNIASNTSSLVAENGDYYYLNLTTMSAILANWTGYVSNSTSVIPNTSYPNTQIQVDLILPYTLKVQAQDWGAQPLNQTSKQVYVYYPNYTLITQATLGNLETTAYFPLNPSAYPNVIVNMTAPEYADSTSGSKALSSSSQQSVALQTAANIRVNISDLAGSPITGAITVQLWNLNTSLKVAEITANSADGVYKFLARNGPASSSTAYFNNTGIAQTEVANIRVIKSSYSTTTSLGSAYQYQPAPFNMTDMRMATYIQVNVFKSWNTEAVNGATVYIYNTTSLVATATTDSSGTVTFIYNHTKPGSSADAVISENELNQSGWYKVAASKTGYANYDSGLIYNFASQPGTPPLNNSINLTENVSPNLTVDWPLNLSSLPAQNINLIISYSDPDLTGGDGNDASGVNASYGNITYWFFNSTSEVRPVGYFNCSSSPCTKSLSDLMNLPTGNMTISFALYDNVGNANITNLTVNVPPAYVQNSGSVAKGTAAINSDDFIRAIFNMTVRGSFARFFLSDFTNATTASTCPTFPYTNITYYNSTGLLKNITAGGGYFNTSGPQPDAWADNSTSTIYSKDQDVNMTFVPQQGICPAGQYSATYGWQASN